MWSIKAKPAHSWLAVSFHSPQVFKHSGTSLNAFVFSQCYKPGAFLVHTEEIEPAELDWKNLYPIANNVSTNIMELKIRRSKILVLIN